MPKISGIVTAAEDEAKEKGSASTDYLMMSTSLVYLNEAKRLIAKFCWVTN